MTSAVNQPVLMPAPFANATALINPISVTPNSPNASLSEGFPVITMTPIDAGGVGPDGNDMQGILNWITQHTTWQSAGGSYKFDAAYSAAVNGYPLGSILQSNDGKSAYVSMENGNTTDFNSVPASIPTLWKPYAGDALTESLPFSAAPNGYVTLPNGIIVQWGVTTSTATGEVTGPFPIPFPNNVFICFGSVMNAVSATAGETVSTGLLLNKTSFDFWTGGYAVNTGIFYVAIGN